MCGKLPTTDNTESPLNKLDETRQILNYANFEIATALMFPAHFRRIITAPMYNGIFCELPYLMASHR